MTLLSQVILSWISVALDTLAPSYTSGINLSAIRALRAVRPLRALRFFPNFRFIVEAAYRRYRPQCAAIPWSCVNFSCHFCSMSSHFRFMRLGGKLGRFWSVMSRNFDQCCSVFYLSAPRRSCWASSFFYSGKFLVIFHTSRTHIVACSSSHSSVVA